MPDCTPQRITTSSDVINDLLDEIARLERELAQALAAQPPADDSRTRLLSALERAAIAETALRALTDECDNDSAPGWEERMSACIAEANRVLAAAPKEVKAQPAHKEQA